MDKKTDLRTIRTQKHLHKALFDLMCEKSIRDITVKELAERAEVSRGTFYLYYDSIQDMIQSVADQSYMAYVDNARLVLDMGLDFRETCRELVVHPFPDEDDFLTFIHLVRSGVVDRSTVTSVVYSIKDEFLRTFTIDADEWMLDYTFQFIAAGLTGAIMHWVLNPNDTHSYSEVAELLLSGLYHARNNIGAIKRR